MSVAQDIPCSFLDFEPVHQRRTTFMLNEKGRLEQHKNDAIIAKKIAPFL